MVEQIGYSVVIEAQLDRFDREMRDAGRVVETVAAGMDKSTKQAARSFNALEAALDPAARATQRYERDVARVKRAIDSGAVSQERAANVLERLHQQYTRAIAVNDNFGASVQRTSMASGRMGGVLQNAGYQVGDFAVQVASGQNPLRAFIQQGTQMISMFGPWGAVVGAAGAVVGALAMSFLDLDDATEKATQAQRSYNELLDLSNQLTGTAKTLAQELAAVRLETARIDATATLRQAERDLEDKREALENARRNLAADIASNEISLGQSRADPAMRERVDEAEKAVREYELALKRARLELAIIDQGLGEFERKAEDAGATATEAIDTTTRSVQTAIQAVEDYADEWARVRNVVRSTQGVNSLTTDGAYINPASQAVFDRANATAAQTLKDREDAQKELNRQVAIANNLFAQTVTPQERYRENVEAIEAAVRAERITTEQATAARRQAMNVFVESDPVLSSMADGLRDVGRSMIDLSGDAGSMGDRVSAAFERMAERILQAAFELQVINPLMNELFGAVYATTSGSGGGGGGIFGSLIGAAASYFGGGGYTTTSVGTIHTGGLAGEGRGITRNVSPALFLGADRFHDGGIPGLRSNEVPAILERGEEVLTVQDPRHRFNMDAGINRTAVAGPTFNIDARGADAEGMARLEFTVRELNGRLNRVDRSIEPRSVEAVTAARRREPGLFGR